MKTQMVEITADEGSIGDADDVLVSIDAASRPIKSVTLFQSNNAEVTRTFADIALEPGRNRIEIKGLPSTIEEDSIRVQGKGRKGNSVLISDVVYHPPKTTGHPEVSKTLTDFLQLEAELFLLTNERTLRERQAKYLCSYGDSLNGETSDIASLTTYLDTLLSIGNTVIKAVSDLDARIDALQRRIVTEREKPQVDARRRRGVIISVVLTAQTNADAEITLTYCCRSNAGAGAASVRPWSPMYDLRVSTDASGNPAGKVQLHLRASISQDTGEDWRGVALTLSTISWGGGLFGGLGSTVPPHRVVKVVPARHPPAAPQAKQLQQQQVQSLFRAQPTLFGNQQAQNVFGNTQAPSTGFGSTGGFGTTAGTASAFGGTSGAGGAFGSAPGAATFGAPTSGPFGAAPAGAGGAFGSTSAFGATGGTGGGLFGTASGAGGGFGSTSAFRTSGAQAPGQESWEVLGDGEDPNAPPAAAESSTTEEPAEFELSSTVISDSAVAHAFQIEGASTIPSGGSTHNVSICTITCDAEVSWIARPGAYRSGSAYMMCRVLNGSDHHLYPGSIAMFLDDSYVAKSSIPHVNPGERFTSSLGVDRHVRVTQFETTKTLPAPESRYAARTTATSHSRVIRIRNDRRVPISRLVVASALPVCEDKAISIELREPKALLDVKGAEGEADVKEGVK
ncbi:hypothetical protein HK101_000556, partial [Irineochytrium annulatum]